MATRITRKQLKTDRFAVEVEHTVDYFAEHQKAILRYAGIAVAVVLIAVAFYFYRKHEHAVREQALADAIQVQEAPVVLPNSATQPPGPVSFASEEAKRKETTKVFTNIATRYSGSDEGLIAEYYLGAIAADSAKTAEAEKFFKEAADGGNKNYASLAKLSLAQIYFADGRQAQGEKLLRGLVDHPTELVTKEQATFALARGIAPAKPAEARKLLEPLRTDAGTVSQLAISALAELPGQ